MTRMQLLDYARFIAAIGVLLFHYTFNGINNGKITSITHIPLLIEFTKYGYLGVNFFFMISGYVILLSAKKSTASQFAVSRAIRLYPAFWFSVLFTSFFAIFYGGSLMSISLSQSLVNSTMVAPLFGFEYVDGVYWTLFYELTFYFAVFTTLFIGLQKYIEILFLSWPFIMLTAYMADYSNLPYLGNYYYFFAAGSILAIFKNQLTYKSIPLLIIFLLCIIFSINEANAKGIIYSNLIIELIITSFFIFFIFLNSKKGSSLILPHASLLGSLTYPVYLIHAHFGYMIISQFATEENKILIYILLISIVLSVAYLIHFIMEIKLSKFWKHLFEATIGHIITQLGIRVEQMYCKMKNK